MIKTVAMSQVVCDRCGYIDNEGDYWAWTDAESALLVAQESDWLISEQSHYCPECIEWDEAVDALVPKC